MHERQLMAEHPKRPRPRDFAKAALCALALAGLACVIGSSGGRAQDDQDGAIELVDPHVFRACADPRNLPFSNEGREGFENKIADLFAKQLGKSVGYAFYPGATGFIRNTLNAHRCDVVLGIAQGDDIVQPTNPYYRTSYAAAYKKGGALDGLEFASGSKAEDRADRRRRRHASGHLSRNGRPPAADQVLCVDGRHAVQFAGAANDVGSRKGRHRRGSALGTPCRLLRRQGDRPHHRHAAREGAERAAKWTYRIVMGVRHSDQNWKRSLNKLIADNQDAINAILKSYGVPLLDENNRPLGP